MERIEELSFDGIARGVPHHGNDAPRRPRRRWPIVLAMALTTLLLACGGAWAYWMWDHHWRLVPVRVNDATFKVRVDTTLGALLADNNDFGHKPGRLLAITGDVERFTRYGRIVRRDAVARAGYGDGDVRRGCDRGVRCPA